MPTTRVSRPTPTTTENDPLHGFGPDEIVVGPNGQTLAQAAEAEVAAEPAVSLAGADAVTIDAPVAATMTPPGLHSGGRVPAGSLRYYGVDDRLWPSPDSSSQTAIFARENGVVVGVILVHDQSGVVLWSEVVASHRRRGIGWRLYQAMLVHRGGAGLRNGCLKGVASLEVWRRMCADPAISVLREDDGGHRATLLRMIGVPMTAADVGAETETHRTRPTTSTT